MTNLGSILKSRGITLPTKAHLVKAMVFPVVMYGCESWDYKESWVLNNWCFWTVVLEKTLESPLDCKEIKPINSKGNQSRILIGRTDAKAEAPILWWPDARTDSLEKTLMLGKIEGGRTRGQQRTRWLEHQQLNGREFEQAPGDGDGQGAWGAAVHGVTKSQTRLRDWTTTMNFSLDLKTLTPVSSPTCAGLQRTSWDFNIFYW